MLQLLVAPVSHRRRSRSTASFLHPLGAVLVRRPPRVRLRRSLLAAAAAPAALERRWRPLHSVAASAAFARPSSFFLSVLRPLSSEPGFADGRFRIQGTEESSLSCTAGDHISRGFNPLNRRSCSVGRAPDCLRQNGRLEVLLHRSVGLRICELLPVRSGYA